ncbi:metal-dependent transcriptional regulator [Desulfobacula sp.]|uniref:metal-dependent transcriptional regulator n=1 Tax=Desulfobacula sp. TaxID=2593537 RepID=UPI00261DEFBC|nr:metal-dependent transcriptional regulator [Desulfobacula sp.]
MAKKNQLSESLEDYLEIILELQRTKTVARSKDIAEKMDIKRGSVTGMLKKLTENKLINYEPYGYVTLTPEGRKIAVEIEHRHIFLKDFLFRILKVDEETADRTACQMEHAMDKQTFKKFRAFLKKIDTCPHCDIEPITD